MSEHEELERLRQEVVRLQARIDELETALVARDQQAPARRGLASLIPGGPAARVG